MTTEQRVKVLFIMGWGRSGSTIISNVLGSETGFVAAGEVAFLWESGFLSDDRRCGCGDTVFRCSFWYEVLTQTSFTRDGALSLPTAFADFADSYLRTRSTFRLLLPQHFQARGFPEFVAAVDALYSAIASTSSARVVIDSSKKPSHAAILRHLPNVDPYFLHLVRDPRAVAHSWRRQRIDPGRPDREYMSQHGASNSTLQWLVRNSMSSAVSATAPERSALLMYEDFAAAPMSTIRAISHFVGEDGDTSSFLDDRTTQLDLNHTLWGNPSRFEVGPVSIRPDDEWRRCVPKWQQAFIGLLTLSHRRVYRTSTRLLSVNED